MTFKFRTYKPDKFNCSYIIHIYVYIMPTRY